jgi:hypothetical protein
MGPATAGVSAGKKGRKAMSKQFPHAAAWSIAGTAVAVLLAVQWSHARAHRAASDRPPSEVEVVAPDRPDRYDFDGLTADVEGVGEFSTRLYHGPVVPQHRAVDLGP